MHDIGTRAREIKRPLNIGLLQGRYRIVRELGSGGMGAVYEAVDERLGATVAIKETFSGDERMRRQFEQEARLLARLHHPALPRVSDYFTEDGRTFLVMQFISGDDLARIISNQARPFPQAQVIAWADQLLDALIYLHSRERQIVHRDIKPHNLKVTESGQIALLDFGLAKTNSADRSTTNSTSSIFGYTRRYSPLEQIQDQGTSPQSDIYALGATIYHLLTGVKPSDALLRAAALANGKSDPLQPASEINSAVGSELAAILDKAMAVHAADRFETANAFRRALSKLGRQGIIEGESEEFALGLNRVSSQPKGNDTRYRTDPFDSYSILKPEGGLMAPIPSRQSAGIMVVMAIAVALGVGALYGFSRVVQSSTPVLNYVRSLSPDNAKPAPEVRRAEPESNRTRPTLTGGKPSGSRAAEKVERKNSQKRQQPNSSPARAGVKLKPPPISISPE